MRINNAHLSGLTVNWVDGPPLPARTRRARRAGEPVSEDSAHVVSSELIHWTSLVHKEPEIRNDLLRTVLERIAQRFYFTPLSAEQTAEAILQAEE